MSVSDEIGDFVRDEPTMEDDVLHLLKLIRNINARGEFVKSDWHELMEQADVVDVWFEDDDPRSMGWVGDDGRP